MTTAETERWILTKTKGKKSQILTVIRGSGRLGQERSADPLKFGAEVRNYIWRLCVVSLQVHLSSASRSIPPYIALTISTISRGGVKINISRYMIKGDF